MPSSSVEIARQALVLAALGYAAYSDIKTREINDAVWLALTAASAPLVLLELVTLDRAALILYLASVYTAFTLGLALLALNLMGEADFLALACLSLVTPPGEMRLLSAVPSLSIFTNSLLVSLSYPLLLFTKNMLLAARGVNLFGDIKVNFATKILAIFTLTKISSDEYLKNRNFYSLAEIMKNGEKKLLFKARIDSMVDSPRGEWIWVSPYVPFVTMVAAGYTIHLLFGCILDHLFASLSS